MTFRDLYERLTPLFTERYREKPADFLYAASDRPPWGFSLGMSIQHALAVLMMLMYSVIAGHAIGLEGAVLRDFLAIGTLIMGFGTLLNGLTTRVSAGHLLVDFQGPVIMTVFISVAGAAGTGAAAGGALASGIALMVLGRFVPKLRLLFPAEISGLLLILMGMSLIPVGIRQTFGLGAGDGRSLAMTHELAATTTLATIVALSIWTTGRLRVLSLLAGAAVGLAVSILLGDFGASELDRLTGEPLFSLPGEHYRPPLPVFHVATIIPYLLTSLMVAVNALGASVMIDRMDDKHWRRTDLPMIGRLLNGLGLCHLLNGLTATPTVAICSVNLGLAQVTGVTARRVGALTGVLLMILAFLPMITSGISLLPKPVIGAVLFFTAAQMMVSGAEMVLSRRLNERRRATVGLGLAAGAAVFMVPDLTASLPTALKPILGSGMVVGVCSAMLLNLVFRLGGSRRAERELGGSDPGLEAARFLEQLRADWGLRRDVVGRAGQAVGETLELLLEAEAMGGPARLKASFDEDRLSLALEYPGRAVDIEKSQAMDLRGLLDEDDRRIDQAMSALSGLLIHSLADGVNTRNREGGSQMVSLTFDH